MIGNLLITTDVTSILKLVFTPIVLKAGNVTHNVVHRNS